MSSIKDVKATCLELMRFSPNVTPKIEGAPGSGKSDVAYQIGEELGYSPDRILVVHINNYDVIDFTGVPSVQDGYTVFNPTKFFYDFREGTGGGIIIFEEIMQSSTHHQTWFAGFELERATPQYKLDPEIRMICTGNRAQDRSGAKPLLAHLNDRLWHFEVDTSLDDWCSWALLKNIDPLGIAFLRLRPALLNDFDPNRTANPTQRSWTKVFQDIPTALADDKSTGALKRYMMACVAKIGEGAAAEWVAARDMMGKMPSIDAIRLKPDAMEVPSEPAIAFAVATSLSMTSTVASFPRDMIYVERMKKEFQMVYVADALRMNHELSTTAPFVAWALKNEDTFRR